MAMCGGITASAMAMGGGITASAMAMGDGIMSVPASPQRTNQYSNASMATIATIPATIPVNTTALTTLAIRDHPRQQVIEKVVLRQSASTECFEGDRRPDLP